MMEEAAETELTCGRGSFRLQTPVLCVRHKQAGKPGCTPRLTGHPPSSYGNTGYTHTHRHKDAHTQTHTGYCMLDKGTELNSKVTQP